MTDQKKFFDYMLDFPDTIKTDLFNELQDIDEYKVIFFNSDITCDKEVKYTEALGLLCLSHGSPRISHYPQWIERYGP